MALSEGLKGFVNFFTKSFNDESEDDAFRFDRANDGYGDVDGTLALNSSIDSMYGTRVKPERSFERESKTILKDLEVLSKLYDKVEDKRLEYMKNDLDLRY